VTAPLRSGPSARRSSSARSIDATGRFSWSQGASPTVDFTWRGRGQLSAQGQAQARQLGRRREDDGIIAVFSSDLARAAQTASIAFGQSAVPLPHDWRLRECRVLVIGHGATWWGLDRM
jgi:broad specificity phosphatase PhoE